MTPVADAHNLWRKIPYALLLAALFAFGCFPQLLTEKIKPSAEGIVADVLGLRVDSVVHNSHVPKETALKK